MKYVLIVHSFGIIDNIFFFLKTWLKLEKFELGQN
jgi:hypothetical protein